MMGLLTPGSPAQAVASQCPSGYFCVWTDSPFTGRFAYFASGSNNLFNDIGGYEFAGKITDIWNRSGVPWCMYSSTGYNGSRVWYNNGARGFTGSFNDRALSLRRVPNPSSLQC
jgi:hypothetical protein